MLYVIFLKFKLMKYIKIIHQSLSVSLVPLVPNGKKIYAIGRTDRLQGTQNEGQI